MSQTAPPPDKNAKPAANKLVPPDERFWQRYSPHAELPLSSAGSLVVHVLIFGLLMLASVLAAWLGINNNRSLPVDAVQLSGGGGNPKGVGEGPNAGDQPVEAASQSNEKQATDTQPNEAVPPPDLKINPATPPRPKFNEPGRQVQMEESSKTFQNLRLRAGNIREPGSTSPSGSSPGKGGTGTGGGSGPGKGRGIGPGSGDGPPANLTERERKQYRWTIRFNYSEPADYLAQLRGLGAILAFPVREHGQDFDYTIVHNLSGRPDHKKKEEKQDVELMLRWRDAEPRGVKAIMTLLHLPPPQVAPEKLHFLACLPVELENKLTRLELDYLRRKYPKHSENDIVRTYFRLKVRNGKYEPEVESMEFN
jgi:hypothetical protein